MRKIVLFLIIGMLIQSIGFGAVGTSAGANTKAQTIIFSQPVIQSQGDYVTIDVSEANNYLIKDNKPLLPSYTHTFTFPIGTKITSVTCTKQNVQTQSLDAEIMPSPQIVEVGSTAKTKTTTTTTDNPYPDIHYKYNIGMGLTDNNERNVIVKVTTYPVRYIPAEDEIEYAQNMKITVNYNPPSESVYFDEVYDLVILSADSFSNQLDSLSAHKNNRGISTKVVTLSEIYGSTYFPANGRDNAEKIKYFIKDAIENWGTQNIILVGGSSEFPTRDTHIALRDDDGNIQDDEIFVSDLYFADIYEEDMSFCSWDSNENSVFAEYSWGSSKNYDDMDLFPDVRIGRLACTSTSEVVTIVNKIITYENSEAYTQNWFNKIVVIGGDTVPNDEEDPDECVDEGEMVNQAVLDVMDGFIPDKIWDSNNRLGGILTTGVEHINDGINSGCGFVDWSGHGSPSVWTTYPHNGRRQSLPSPYPPGNYYNSYNSNLDNGNQLPIVMCGGCSLGKFQSNDNCFAWAYLSNPDGGGIASVGATGLGYVYIGRWVTYGLVEGFMINLYEEYNNGAITFGEMWDWAINSYISGDIGGHDYKTLTELIPFGDPTLAIAADSLAPLKPDAPVGPDSGSIDTEYTYEATTTDPDGDKISYLFDWGDETYSGWTDYKNSGQKGTASHKWSTEGSFDVRVKAKDIHGVQGEWSDPLPISMPRDKNRENTFLDMILQKLINTFPSLEINGRSQGTFEAELGLRGNDEPLASLDGQYKSRGRFIVFSGTATNGELEGRFRGLFRGNLMIIKLPVRGRVLTIYGRVSFDEQQLTFTGNWKARGFRAGGWITGSLKL